MVTLSYCNDAQLAAPVSYLVEYTNIGRVRQSDVVLSLSILPTNFLVPASAGSVETVYRANSDAVVTTRREYIPAELTEHNGVVIVKNVGDLSARESLYLRISYRVAPGVYGFCNERSLELVASVSSDGTLPIQDEGSFDGPFAKGCVG
jgi:hypothetical protein